MWEFDSKYATIPPFSDAFRGCVLPERNCISHGPERVRYEDGVIFRSILCCRYLPEHLLLPKQSVVLVVCCDEA